MKKLLIVIDYQVDFVSGALGFRQAALLEDGICDRIREVRENGGDVWFTLDTHTDDYLSTSEGGHLPVPHCIKGTAGWELYGKVASLSQGCTVIEKPSFGSIELVRLLSQGPRDEIELVGVVTNICVITNAAIIKAALPEATVRVNSALTASNDPTLHQKALEVMASFQIEII